MHSYMKDFQVRIKPGIKYNRYPVYTWEDIPTGNKLTSEHCNSNTGLFRILWDFREQSTLKSSNQEEITMQLFSVWTLFTNSRNHANKITCFFFFKGKSFDRSDGKISVQCPASYEHRYIAEFPKSTVLYMKRLNPCIEPNFSFKHCRPSQALK